MPFEAYCGPTAARRAAARVRARLRKTKNVSLNACDDPCDERLGQLEIACQSSCQQQTLRNPEPKGSSSRCNARAARELSIEAPGLLPLEPEPNDARFFRGHAHKLHYASRRSSGVESLRLRPSSSRVLRAARTSVSAASKGSHYKELQEQRLGSRRLGLPQDHDHGPRVPRPRPRARKFW